ncbi:MAG: hypothetical protein ACQEP6_02240 [Patescibacteria group bacterium]
MKNLKTISKRSLLKHLYSPLSLKKRTLLLFLVLFLITPFLFFVPETEKALSNPQNPFGGKINSIKYCPCTPGILLEVGPPREATVMYLPGQSTLYAYYNIYKTGVWLLGTHTGSSRSCRVYSNTGCTTIGSGYVIEIVGTSH